MRKTARNVRSRIIIHAGFAKCGSASIRAGILRNFSKLKRRYIFVFDKNLRIARAPADLVGTPGTPIWRLAEARKKSEKLTHKLADEIAAIVRRKTGYLAILSAENLANPDMAELFVGLDRQFEVDVIFYLRPQRQWIPSAWKQWGLKKGVPLTDFVSQCIDHYRPAFKASIDTWKTTLPAATVHVRFLIPELLTGGNPASDLFHLLAVPEAERDLAGDPQNPSLDVAILHVLLKNLHLFSGVHDNTVPMALTGALPKRFRATNIQMLSPEEEARIEERFRDENLWLLKTYCRGIDVERMYQAHFMPRAAKTTYADMTDIDLIYRCLGIILEAIAFSGGQMRADETRNPAPNPFEVREE